MGFTRCVKGWGVTWVVISTYWVVHKPTSSLQQQTLLIQSKYVLMDPHHTFWQALQVHVQQCQAKRIWNSFGCWWLQWSFRGWSAGMASIAIHCNLIDLMHTRHSSADRQHMPGVKLDLIIHWFKNTSPADHFSAAAQDLNHSMRFHTDHRDSFFILIPHCDLELQHNYWENMRLASWYVKQSIDCP